MLFILLAAVFIGVGAAGAVLLSARVTGRAAPRWLAPVAAGAAMFAFMLWNEYSWYGRVVAALPDTVVVAATYPHATLLQPWTLAVPRVARFAAVDLTAARRDPAMPGTVTADVLLVTRLEGTVRIAQVFDCDGARRADLAPAVSGGAAADPQALVWRAADAGDPLLRAACGGPDGEGPV